MLLFNPLIALWKRVRPRSIYAAEGLHPPRQTHRILERERCRAERTGEALSVLLFTPRHPGGRETALAFLVQALQSRLRITDEAGWLDGHQACAILPGATPEGAWKVADDLCAHFPQNVLPPLCTVYGYPPDGSGPSGNGKASPRETAAVAPSRHVLALETLFLQPLPAWKRVLDVTGALVGLVVFLPTLAALAAAVRATSPGPVFFRQWRSGRGGRPFLLYKFRTMVADAEARKKALLTLNERDGPAFKIKKDPRVTAIGRLLRATSLDELPQLWNVLKGDMSLVGPRPLPCQEAEACARWQRRRLDVMPGLTCIWQVWGRGGVAFADWIRMDVRYIRSLSLLQDLKLLALTVPAVLLRRGAH